MLMLLSIGVKWNAGWCLCACVLGLVFLGIVGSFGLHVYVFMQTLLTDISTLKLVYKLLQYVFYSRGHEYKCTYKWSSSQRVYWAKFAITWWYNPIGFPWIHTSLIHVYPEDIFSRIKWRHKCDVIFAQIIDGCSAQLFSAHFQVGDHPAI